MNKQWSAIIACAGKGTRLSTDPKALYPIGDKLLIDYITPHICKFARTVFVVGGEQQQSNLSAHLQDFMATSCETEIVFAVQQDKSGTADAVRQGLEHVATEFCMVLWGDQLVHPSVVDEGISLEDYARSDVICPVISAENPYVHLRIVNDRVKSVNYAREGAEMPKSGATDAGVFFFRTTSLRHHLAKAIADNSLVGENSNEHNFPTLLTRFPKIRLLPISGSFSVGVNTPADAIRAASIVRSWV